MALESWSFRTAVKESRPFKGDASWFRFIRRSKQPELPVVLLEDSGALIGLVIALFAVTMSALTGNGRWDGAGTIAIGLLLGVIAIVLAIEMKSLLIGESASEEDEAAIAAAIVAADSVVVLIDLRTEHIGPEAILVAAKVRVRPGPHDAPAGRRGRRGGGRHPRRRARRVTDLPRARRREADEGHVRRADRG